MPNWNQKYRRSTPRRAKRTEYDAVILYYMSDDYRPCHRKYILRQDESVEDGLVRCSERLRSDTGHGYLCYDAYHVRELPTGKEYTQVGSGSGNVTKS